ncbi:Rossmann-fold NAD(P)-binding domain-containing protein [Ligilactobacillus agilis]|uniref:hypothetical protein n=1 Tax=Ligilactobacillus agilis TaxID=1601 RepID=UPI0028CB43D0|nr:hypothetical protein [Ligilactobacillus agilis]
MGVGNVGTQLAVHYASRGATVKIYSSKPQLFKKELQIIDNAGTILAKGSPQLVTDSLAAAVSGSELILITVPAFLVARLAN